MRKPANLIQISHRKITYLIVILIALVSVTPALAEYLGPDRTRTEPSGTCKVILNECQYVSAKGDYRYHMVNSWSCSNESKPWQAYPSSAPRACTSQTVGDKYWERDEGGTITVTYPPATISGTLQNCTLQNGWCVTVPSLSLTGSEPVTGYSILAIEGTRNSQNFACSGSNCIVPLVEGQNQLTYWALSSFADTSLMGTLSAKVDSQGPTITGTLIGTAGSNGWYTGPITLNGSAADTTSGLASFNCTLDGVSLASCGSIIVDSNGPHTLILTARDVAGNIQTFTQNASIDSQPPILNASINGTRGSNDWYTAAALSGSATDPSPGSGLSAFEYNLDEGDWTIFPASGILTLPEGSHMVNLRAVDQAGHAVTSSRSFLLDRSTPVVTIHPSGTLGNDQWYTTPLSLSASADDEISGMEAFEYSIDAALWSAYSGPIILEEGIHTISFWAEDKAGRVTQEEGTYKVDSRPPQIAGNISGVPGQNGWFTSEVTLSASASDPAPGSGMDAFTYTLNSDPETPYSDSLHLTDGQHIVQLHVQDNAGLSYSLEESFNVDTNLPSLSIDTTLPAWVRDNVLLSGTASDGGSGLSSVEISNDGGQTWQALENPASWNYGWNTLAASSGAQEILLRATDNAGLIYQQSLKTGVDNQPPMVSMPATWFQWDTVTLDVWDDHSGLSEASLQISDTQSRWPTRIIQLDETQFPLHFTWDRRFGDGTTAPAGTYNLKLTATDRLGHSTERTASIKVLLAILPPGPTSTPQPPTRPALTPTPTILPTASPTIVSTQTSVVWIFGNTLEPEAPVTPTPGSVATPRATPTQNSVEDWFESVFGTVAGAESTNEIGSMGDTDSNSTAQESGVLWGAAAAAMMGAMTSYALDEKRKREEEIAQQIRQEAEEQERRDKARAQKMEKIEEQRAQERLWEQARLDKEVRTQARQDAQLLQRGPEAQEDEKWMASQIAILQKEEEKRLIKERWNESRMQANLLRQEAEDGARWLASQAEIKDTYNKHQAEGWQEGLAAYYNARKQGEMEAPQPEPNWWEQTKSFVNEKVIEPINNNIYQPWIKPVVDWRRQVIDSAVDLLDEKIYQPLIKPAVASIKQFTDTENAWIDKHINQPFVQPTMTWLGNQISSSVSWLNEKVYQPYIGPVVEKTAQLLVDEFAWINENIYQPYFEPYVGPVIDKSLELIKEDISWLNKNIYQPILAPVVNDINKYILKPTIKKAGDWWGEYGEWVHGALDVVGLIPGAGEIADGINGLIYLAEGRKLEATLSLISAVPVLGYFGQGGKLVLKAGQEVVDTVVGTVAKGVFSETIQKAAKESLEQVAEITVKNSGDWIQTVVDVVGCIPGAGTLATDISGLIHLGKGRFLDATFSAVSLVPVVGDALMTGKEIVESSLKRIINKSADEMGGQLIKESTETLLEKVQKRIKKDVRENAFIENINGKDGDTPSTEKTTQFIDSLTNEYGDRAIAVLNTVPPENAEILLKTLDPDVLDYALQEGPDAVEALSLWSESDLREHGVELALRAKKDAQVIADVRKLIELQPIDPKNLTSEQRALIKSIAGNSTQYPDAGQIVLGKWVDQGSGFVETARNTGSTHYNPHSKMWDMLGSLGKEGQNEVAWLINKQVVQSAIDRGMPIEYTLNGVPTDTLESENAAIMAVFSGSTDAEIMSIVNRKEMPIRTKELQELYKAGCNITFDEINNSYLFAR